MLKLSPVMRKKKKVILCLTFVFFMTELSIRGIVFPMSSLAMPGVHGSTTVPVEITPTKHVLLHIGADDTATAVGIVLENLRDCYVDGSCVLRLQTGKQIVEVLYHPGRGPSCPNVKAMEQGAKVERGNMVKVHGKYLGQNGEVHFVSTCASKSFFIAPFKP